MKKFLKQWLAKPEDEKVTPVAPDGERIYAIGDIHGCLKPLQQLQELILEDARNFSGRKKLVYLGDYVDRGEQSREVIELLLNQPLPGFSHEYLLGNHEQSMLDFLQHPKSVAAWLTYGGKATLRSYGINIGNNFGKVDIESLRDDFAYCLPQSHLDFLRSMKLYYLSGSYCFVHAGIRPGIPLTEQSQEDLLWIRDDFTQSQVNHSHIIIHGHSITTEVAWKDNRIGIDTGAFQSGVLTCLVLEAADQRLLQTGSAGLSSQP